MADFWNLIVQSNTFNFAILAIIIAIVCAKINMPKVIEDIRNEIASAIEKAIEKKKEAEKELKKTIKIVKNTDLEIQEKIANANQNAKLLSDEINKNSKITVQQIKDSVERIIKAEEKKLGAKLTNETIKNSIELAKENILQKLNEDINLHNSFIEKSIEELDKIKL